MASGSNYLTTYYAKRIIGDAAAETATKALLQTGTGITNDIWILHRTNRVNLYGIKYMYDDTTNGTADRIELYGGHQVSSVDTATAWVQLDTGDVYILGRVGINYDPSDNNNTYSLYVNGTTYVYGTTYLNDAVGIGYDPETRGNTYKLYVNGDIYGDNNFYLNGKMGIGYNPATSGNTYKLYVDGDTYFDDNTYLNGKVGIGYNPNTSGNTYKLYVNGTTYLTDHLYIGRTNSSHIYLINKNWTKGSIPSSQTYSALEFNSNDLANNRVALLEATLDTSGNSQFNIFLVPNIANSTSWSGIILKKDINDILTINIDGTTTINGHLHLEAGKSIYFRYNDSEWPVLQNYNNSNITLNACGGGIHIGYINTPNTYIFYSNSGSAGTKFFEVNSDGSYALTRFGVNGQNTSYNFYVNGSSYLGGNITSNGNLYIKNTSPHIILANTNWTKGTQPSTNYYSALEFQTNSTDYASNKRLGLLEVNIDTSNNTWMNIWVVPNASDSTSWSGIRLKKTSANILTIYNQGNTEVSGTVTATSTIHSNGGYLQSTCNSNTVTIGSQNTGWCHFINSADRPFYFNHKVHAVDGFTVYNTSTSLTDNNLTFSQGGGWYMIDTTWIRAVNNKSMYTPGTIRGDTAAQSRRFESYDGGATYIGHSNNASWVYVQDIASQSGTNKWAIHQANGNAEFYGTVTVGTLNGAHVNINGTKRDLQIRYGGVTLNYAQYTTVTFSPAFSNACLMVAPINQQVGYGAGQAISVDSYSKTSCRMYNYNTASAACWCGYIAIGY